MVDVSVDFVLERDEPIQADFELEPDVTYTADIMLSSASSFHNELYNRDLPDQHPMSAITGLESAIEGLSEDIIAENNRAIEAEETLDNKIDSETDTRIEEITRIEGLISAEETRAKNAEQTKVDKVSTANRVYGTDSQGNQTTYDKGSFGQVDDVQVGGVSVVTNKVAELGTMAGETASDYSTTAVADTLYANISYEGTIDNHIADTNNPHSVTKSQVGLGNVDNTSDTDKPISTATQTALNSKQNTLTAGSGINISGSTISVAAPALTNTATGDDSITVLGSPTSSDYSVNIGFSSAVSADYGTAVGHHSSASAESVAIGASAGATISGAIAIGNNVLSSGADSIAIGFNSESLATSAIQLGSGSNSEARSLYVATANNKNWKMLGNDGLIPDARISNNIARASDIPTTVSELTNDSNYQTATQVANSISVETQNRENADIGLQNQIDAIVSSSDVFDIVGTYAELQAYDITTVPVNDIIKVLVDETHSGAATYYRCVESGGVKSWSYIGSEGAYYTKGEADSTFVPQTRTVNSKALSSNITLTASDVGALPDTTVIPTVNNPTITIQKNGSTVQTFTLNQSSNATANITVPTATSDLTNDSGFLTSADLSTIESDIEDLQDANKVINVVSTYAELQSYNTSTVTKNSIIKVIADETNSGKTSWYQWSSQGAGTAFVQPTLTADGTLGGADFACACDSTYNRGGNPDYAWHAFDGRTNVSTTYPSSFWNSGSGQPHWIEFYNPEPLAVTNIKIYNGESGSVAKDWQFQCSDDGSTWTTLTSGTNTTTGQGADWNFNVTDSGNHKYYRFYTTSAQGSFSAHTTIAEIEITGIVGAGYGWTRIKDEGKYATETWVTSQGYITSAALDTKQDKLTSANAGTDISIVSEILPSAYKRVTGFTMNNDCYFEITGFHLKGSDTLRFSMTPTAGAINVLGCYTSSSATDNFSLYVGLGSTNKYLRYNGGTYSSQIVTNTRYDVVITPTGATGLGQSSTWTAQTFTSVADFCIGTTSSSATSSKFVGTLHGEIVVDGRARFIPCERISDNVLGYYEYESGIFYTPAVGTPVSTGYDNIPSLTISFTNDTGYITGITSGDVTTALGYTPYNSSNPNGYTSNVGTVTSVNNVSPDSNGNVTLTSVTVDQTYDATSANAQSGVAIAGAGFLTGISSSDVTTALGYTPYNSSNPDGYTDNVGTVTSVNNVSPDNNGNVSLSIPTATSDLSNDSGFITGISSSDVTTALGYTPANDSGVVKTSGNQTVGGDKTFTSCPKTSFATSDSSAQYNDGYKITDSSLDISTNPAYSKTYYYAVRDKNNRYSAYIAATYGTDGSSQTSIAARTRNTDNSGNVDGSIFIKTYRDGTVTTFAPTPATSDDSTKIATTAYVKAQGYALDNDVVKTSGDQSIGGIKTFSSAAKFAAYNGIIILGTDHYYQMRSSGGTPEGCALFLDNDTSKVAFSAGTSTITIGSANITPLSVTPATSDNSTKIATTAFVNNWVTANTSNVHVVVETYESGSSWYRIYDDGWIEQGGWKSGFSSANTFENVNLHKPFADTYYNVQVSGGGSVTTIYNYKIGNSSTNTTTAFKLLASNTGAACFWYACGQGA